MGARDVYAVDLEGRRRLVYRSPGVLGLVDTAPDGRALFHRSLDRYGRDGAPARQPRGTGRDCLRQLTLGSFSVDGRMLLLNSPCEGAGPQTSAYLRRDGGDPIRVAAGSGVDISPDGRSTLVVTDNGGLSVVPIGPGLSRKLDLGALRAASAAWVPSRQGGIIVRGRERPDEPLQPVADRRGRVQAAKARRRGCPSPGRSRRTDRHVAARTAIGTVSLIPLAGGPPASSGASTSRLCVSRWSGDGRSLFLAEETAGPARSTVWISPRRRSSCGSRWRRPTPPGMVLCADILPSADGRSYAYAANRSLASLIVAEGLR